VNNGQRRKELSATPQQTGALPSKACTWIGASPSQVEILYVRVKAGDSADVIAFKAAMVDALLAAPAGHVPVQVTHDDTSGDVTQEDLFPGFSPWQV
jgi:hypothetical protein